MIKCLKIHPKKAGICHMCSQNLQFFLDQHFLETLSRVIHFLFTLYCCYLYYKLRIQDTLLTFVRHLFDVVTSSLKLVFLLFYRICCAHRFYLAPPPPNIQYVELYIILHFSIATFYIV